MALQHYEKALAIKQSIQGKDSVDAASTMTNIGAVYDDQGDFPRAVEMYKRAIAIYEKHQLRHRGSLEGPTCCRVKGDDCKSEERNWHADAHLNLGNSCEEGS